MAGKSFSSARYYCKACKLWIADNRAQRDQHNRGAKHKAAVNAQLEDIARRNAEKSRAKAENRARIATIEALAQHNNASGTGLVPTYYPASSSRADLLERVASATTARSVPADDLGRTFPDYENTGDMGTSTVEAVAPQAPSSSITTRTSSFLFPPENSQAQQARDSRGYGQWEEVVDVERAVTHADDESNPKTNVEHREMRLGAIDENDEEEALARDDAFYSDIDLSKRDEAEFPPRGVIFKSRGRRAANKRRKR